jgi:hypothetical protein
MTGETGQPDHERMFNSAPAVETVHAFGSEIRRDPLARAILDAINRTVREHSGVKWEHIESALDAVRVQVAWSRILARDESGVPVPPGEWQL